VTANFSDNPRSVLAYHALAWLNFRSQNYDRGLECLEQAVSRVSDPNRPYDKHLLESAGQLSAFARWAVDDPKLYPKLSQVLETVKGKGGEGPYRAALEGVHGIVKDRKQAIEQESDSAKKAVLELQLKNVNSYADFDFSYAWTYLEESLAALK
jgi:tetratricopeptide (TPR) repeat protein